MPTFVSSRYKQRFGSSSFLLVLTDAVPGVFDSVEEQQNGCQMEHVSNEPEDVHF
jgi:hypothetical protein